MLSIHCSSCVKSWRNRKNPERITKIKPFMNKYKWKGIHFQSEKDDWTKADKNIVNVAFNVFYVKNTYIPCLCFKT